MWIRVDDGRELLNTKYLKSIKLVCRPEKCSVYALEEKTSSSDDSFFHLIATGMSYNDALSVVNDITNLLDDECYAAE